MTAERGVLDEEALADVFAEPMMVHCYPAEAIVATIKGLLADNKRMRGALEQLEQWDMLTLDGEGHGVATGDASWARALIATSLTPLEPS